MVRVGPPLTLNAELDDVYIRLNPHIPLGAFSLGVFYAPYWGETKWGDQQNNIQIWKIPKRILAINGSQKARTETLVTPAESPRRGLSAGMINVSVRAFWDPFMAKIRFAMLLFPQHIVVGLLNSHPWVCLPRCWIWAFPTPPCHQNPGVIIVEPLPF